MLFSLTEKTVSERRWMDPKSRLQYCLHEFNVQQTGRESFMPGLAGGVGAHVPGTVSKRFAVIDEWGPAHLREVCEDGICHRYGKMSAPLDHDAPRWRCCKGV